MLNMFCPQVHLAKRWLFTSAVQDTNVIVGLKLLTTGTNVTTVFCAQERNKIWFKISSNGNRRQQHIHASSFQDKNLNIAISYCSFCKFLRNEDLSQEWAYFTLKLGWLKTNAGTNIRPQNNMYLSAPEYPSG